MERQTKKQAIKEATMKCPYVNQCNQCKVLKLRVKELTEIIIEAMESTGIMKGLNQGLRKKMELEKAKFVLSEEKNPAHFCDCGKFLGHRGFCSDECHNKHYDVKSEEVVK